ncbi:hypothetical protein C4577_00135 [Candidatus Parcubacteria bacterium]|nr:MAG: hypothetical protein C4577_00135 [Candidatus Parcubacteria bacterium]
MVFGSPWRNAEREFALGIITTVAIRKGKWCAVEASMFGEILKQVPFHIFPAQDTINAVWALGDEGYLEIVTVDGKDHILPNPELAEILNHCQLRYA